MIFTGGPAYRQGELEVKDEILEVSQEVTGSKWQSASGDLIRAISFIKGPKDTPVRLKVKKKNGVIKEIIIKRGTINYDFFFSKSAILEEKRLKGKKNKFKVGYIKLPSFYQNFQKPNNNQENSRCSIDIRNDINDLKKNNVSNIILDLRGNGGGSLQEVIHMVNFFVGPDTVVQVRDKNGQNYPLPQISFRNTVLGKRIFDGELLVLIDNISASASEIFAAAIQDHNRGIIVGIDSFGKGTVQNVQPLPSKIFGEKNAIKCTIQKFYRINGTTTQKIGVVPDIYFPMINEVYDVGEKFYKNILPADKIKKAPYNPLPKINQLVVLKEMSQERIQKSLFFQNLNQMITLIKKNKQKTKFPLSYSKLKKENNLFKKKLDKIEEKMNSYKNLSFIFNKKYRLNKLRKKSLNNKEFQDRIQTRDEWHSKLLKDPYIEESFKILKDLEMIKKI